MPLASGSRLGPYEVVSAIGAGGMGEVYRARDPRLGREVAVKVIGANGAESPESLRRFEVEARAVAALAHPHILNVYDVGFEEGTPYVVFELLEGQTLRVRLGRGPLPPRKAVELAVQVCAGLAAAHARGIIHRDLKPDNLFITKDGGAKILDFGLAKLTQPLDDLEDPSTRTRTDKRTWVGTVGYVSPEQLRKGHADARSDLFSLGATLYEMLAGRPAFRGSTPADTLSAILNSDPPPITETLASVPASLERVVRRCLEKDPEERFQSARDLGFALEAVAGSGPSESAALPTIVAPSRRWPKAVAALLALVVAVGGGLLAGRALFEKPIPSFKQLTFRRGWMHFGRFGPDGRTVFYAAAWDGKPLEIFSTRTDAPESRALGPRFARVLSVSSTGQIAILKDPDRQNGFFFLGTLAVAPVGGGTPRELLEDVREADWTPDGRDLCVLRGVDGQNQIELPPSHVAYRTPHGVVFLRMAPTGHHVAFVESSELGQSVVVLDLATKQSRVLAANIPANFFGLAWAPSGNEVWFTAGDTTASRDILAVDLSGRQRLIYRSASALSIVDISRDGRLLLHRGTDRWGVMARGPGESNEREVSAFGSSTGDGLSADGRTLILNETVGTTHSVYLRRMGEEEPVRLAEGFGFDPSPDGKSVLVTPDNGTRLMDVPIGPGLPHSIELGGMTVDWATWVPPRGERIVFNGGEAGGPRSVWVVGRSGGAPRAITALSGWARSAVSPDGRHVAMKLANHEVSIVPIDGGDTREFHGLSADLPTRWSADGRSLFLLSFNKMPCQVHKLDLTTEKLELWLQAAPSDPAGLFFCGGMIVSEDGRTYAYNYGRALTDLFVAEGFR